MFVGVASDNGWDGLTEKEWGVVVEGTKKRMGVGMAFVIPTILFLLGHKRVVGVGVRTVVRGEYQASNKIKFEKLRQA